MHLCIMSFSENLTYIMNCQSYPLKPPINPFASGVKIIVVQTKKKDSMISLILGKYSKRAS